MNDNNSAVMVDSKQFVTFFIGEEEFGFDIGSVQEIISPIKITQVPNSNRFVKGVINLRGKIIPIYDLKERLKGVSLQIDPMTKIIVAANSEHNIGFLVCRVNEVSVIPKSKLLLPSEKLNDEKDAYIESIANLDDRLVSILDLNRLFHY